MITLRGLSVFVGVALTVWFTGCGEHVTGTESGNPINPLPPPVADPPPEAEPPGPMDESPQSEPPPGGPPESGGPPPPTAGGGEDPPSAPDPEADGQPPPGGPGAPPGAPCELTACENQAADAAHRLGGAQPAPPPFTSAECVVVESSPGCECGPLVRITSESCGVTDRFGRCLYAPDEFPGCGVARDLDAGAATCSAVCEDVHLRLLESAAQMTQVSVRAHACVAERCRYVLTNEDACYVAEPLIAADCSLPDEELLAE